MGKAGIKSIWCQCPCCSQDRMLSLSLESWLYWVIFHEHLSQVPFSSVHAWAILSLCSFKKASWTLKVVSLHCGRVGIKQETKEKWEKDNWSPSSSHLLNNDITSSPTKWLIAGTEGWGSWPCSFGLEGPLGSTWMIHQEMKLPPASGLWNSGGWLEPCQSLPEWEKLLCLY